MLLEAGFLSFLISFHSFLFFSPFPFFFYILLASHSNSSPLLDIYIYISFSRSYSHPHTLTIRCCRFRQGLSTRCGGRWRRCVAYWNDVMRLCSQRAKRMKGGIREMQRRWVKNSGMRWCELSMCRGKSRGGREESVR